MSDEGGAQEPIIIRITLLCQKVERISLQKVTYPLFGCFILWL